MKTIIWRFRYTRRVRKLIGVSWLLGWDMSGSALENVKGDLTESPEDCAQEEAYAWADCSK